MNICNLVIRMDNSVPAYVDRVCSFVYLLGKKRIVNNKMEVEYSCLKFLFVVLKEKLIPNTQSCIL